MKQKILFGVIAILAGFAHAVDFAQFGVMLGGSYSSLSGADANDMAVYVEGVEFDDGRQPFGYTNDTKQEPTGSFGPVVGAFLRIDLTQTIYSRFEVYYMWKGAEYEKSIDAMETYYGGPNGEHMADTVASIQARLDQEGEGEILDGMRRWVISSSYLEIPVLLGFDISREFTVYAGPHVSYLLGSTFEAHVTESDSYMDEELIEGKKSYTNVKQPIAEWDMGALVGVGYSFTEQFQLSLRYSTGFSKMLDGASAPDITQNSLQLVASLNFSDF